MKGETSVLAPAGSVEVQVGRTRTLCRANSFRVCGRAAAGTVRSKTRPRRRRKLRIIAQRREHLVEIDGLGVRSLGLFFCLGQVDGHGLGGAIVEEHRTIEAIGRLAGGSDAGRFDQRAASLPGSAAAGVLPHGACSMLALSRAVSSASVWPRSCSPCSNTKVAEYLAQEALARSPDRPRCARARAGPPATVWRRADSGL